MADTTYLPKVYKKAGGNEQVIASGGKQTVESGGIVDFESGSYLKIAGVAVTATAEQLNGMTSTIEVKNSSGGDYTAGTLVYVSGWSGTTPTVTKADADAIASMATHVLTEAIANGATGTADGEATISNIDTSGAGDVGSPAYLSATVGGFAWTAPTGVGQVAQMVGLCKTKHATTGSMWFFPAYGYVIAQPASTLQGVTASADELNLLDGSTAGTVVASKAVVVGANKNLDTLAIADGGLKLGADAGTAVSSTAAELNLLDGSTAGTVVASKAVVVGANKNLDTLAIADGGLKLGADAGTAVTSTAAELNILDGVTADKDELNLLDGSTAGTAVASKALVLGATKNVDTLLVDVATPAATGANQGNSTALTADSNLVTGADNTTGVVLPTAVAGRRVFIKNTVENKTLAVWPATGAAVNALGANAVCTLPAGCLAVFLAASATQWYSTVIPDGITASAAELNLADGSVAGTAVASKLLALGADKNVDVLAIADGGLYLGAGAGTAVSSTAAELNLLDTATAGTAVASKALVLGATKNVDTLLIDVATPAATGANQGNSTALTADTNLVTGADDTTGVVLPVAVAGRRIIIKNTVADKVLPVWPATGAAINALGANAVCTLPAGCLALFAASSATQWYTTAVPDGITATAAELNKLDGAGVNVTAANLDILTGGAGTALHTHALAAGASDVTASAAEVSKLAGSGANVTAANLATLTGGGATVLHSHALANNQFWFESQAGLVNTGYELLDACDALGNWAASGANFLVAADAVTFKKGTGSLKLTCAGAAALNDSVDDATTHTSENWTGEYVGFWARTDAALSAGDVKLKIVDGVAGAQYVNLPAMATVDTWVFIRLDISGLTATDVDAYGFAVSDAGKVKTFNLRVDNLLRYDASGLITLAKTPLAMNGAFAIPIAAASDHAATAKAEDTAYWVDYTNKQVIFVADESTNVWFLAYCYTI